MFKSVGAGTALAVLVLAAPFTGHTASYDPAAAASKPLTKDLGTPSKPQTAPVRINSGDAGDNTMKLAGCKYRWVTDFWGISYYQWSCD
jgi:hypothetical protein